MARDLEGLIQLLSSLVPTNDNPRAWITWNEYIKGSDQNFASINDLIAFHPNRMQRGMQARVIDYPLPGNISQFALAADPTTLVDGNGDSIIDGNNFVEYWDQLGDTGLTTGFDRVYEYAPDGPGGGAPPFPYETDPGFESNWNAVYDATASHKWIRFRDDDVDDNADGIFDYWTAPIPINQSYESGDYIDIRFKREPGYVDTIYSSTAGMSDAVYYIVLAGSVNNTSQAVIHTKGAIFQYVSADSYTFSTSPVATVQQFIAPIPRTSGGAPNNDPVGWSDTVPGGTDQLFKATGQKSVYGQLKSAWIITKVQEDPNYIRYSSAATPYPGEIVGVDTDAGTATQGDTDLNAAGWSSVYSNQVFIATRQDDQNPSSPKYTPWLVQKIAEESGEYVDRVYKLYPVGLDSDSVLIVAPTKRDATEEGWSDVPLEEPANEVNYYSEARKFFDGTLKSNWTKPFPYTGQDVIADTIVSDLGDEFKYDQELVITPAEIELTAQLYRGTAKIWEEATGSITYVWKKIYDNGVVVDVSPTSNSGDDFYTKSATGGAPGIGEFLLDQRVGIKPGAVTGKAVFECTQTFDPGSGAPVLVFVDTYSLVDVSDGIDAKSISMRADSQLIVWDSAGAIFAPETFQLSAFQSNIPTGDTFYWYKYDGASWVEFTASDANHVFPDGVNKGVLLATAVNGTENTVPDLTFTTPGPGAQAQITSAGSNMPALSVSDEFSISNHSLPENNGVYIVITVNTSTSDYEVDKIGTSPSDPSSAVAESATMYTSLSKLLNTDQNKQELRYAVTNTQSDPDTADYATKFSDFITITKLGSTSTGAPGSDSVGMLLSNEAHVIALDSSTYDPQAGQTGNTGTAVTTVELFNGVTHLDYGTDYTAGNITVSTKSTSTGVLTDVTFDWEPAGNNILLFVNTWVGSNSVISGVCQVSITYAGNTYSKDFTVTGTLDAPGAIILDIDSDKGFSFVPTDRTDKTLTAALYDNNVVDTTDNWTYRWLLNDVQVKAKTLYSAGGQQYVLQSSQIQGGGYIKCEVYTSPGDVLTRSRTVYIQDITDAKRYLLYFNYDADPSASEPLATPPTPLASTVALFNSAYPATGSEANHGAPTQAGWGRNPGTWTYWTSEGIEQNDKTLIFTAPVRIKGETGIQGISGRFYLEQYNSNGNDDVTPHSTPTGLNTGGWSTSLPATDVIWGSRRLYENDATTPAPGSSWSSPYLVTGRDGNDGNDGVSTQGWSPVFAFDDFGSYVNLQLVDWVGGTGTKPGFIGYWVGATGLNPFPSSSANIKGADGQDVQYLAPVIKTATNTQVSYDNNSGRTRAAHINMRGVFISTGSNDSSSTAYLQISLNDGTWFDLSNMAVTIGTTNNDVRNEFSLDYHYNILDGVKVEFRRRLAFGSNQSVAQERITMLII